MNAAALEIVESTPYCVVATIAPGNVPQSIPVRFAYDNSYIYFRSSSDSSHSKNLLKNPRISITIFDTTQSVKGAIYIHSSAEKLDGANENPAVAVFSERFDNPPNQWADTVYYRVPVGKIDENKTVERMFYFQEYAA